jgi:hypothetical protein
MQMSSYLKKELIDHGYSVIDIEENILLVENFISDEELKQLWDIINSTEEKEWLIAYQESLAEFCLHKFGRDDVENLVAEGKYEITQGWDDKILNIQNNPLTSILQERIDRLVQENNPEFELTGMCTLQRMQEGVELKSHVDQDTDPSVRYSTILYLNDDYSEGELFFKNFDITVRPKPKSLLVFPGTAKYEHGVKHVGPGPIRQVIVGFVKEKDFYKNNKY